MDCGPPGKATIIVNKISREIRRGGGAGGHGDDGHRRGGGSFGQ